MVEEKPKEEQQKAKQEEVELRSLVPVKEEEFEFLDKKDEEQIIEEMRGNILSEYVYVFCRKHRDGNCACSIRDKVVALSWAGVKRIIHMRKDIETDLVEKTENDKEFQIIMKAKDVKSNITAFGGAQQPKKSNTFKGGMSSIQDDPFALAKCVTKALRNSWRNLIPETEITVLIKEKLEQEGVKLVSARLAGTKPGTVEKEA